MQLTEITFSRDPRTKCEASRSCEQLRTFRYLSNQLHGPVRHAVPHCHMHVVTAQIRGRPILCGPEDRLRMSQFRKRCTTPKPKSAHPLSRTSCSSRLLIKVLRVETTFPWLSYLIQTLPTSQRLKLTAHPVSINSLHPFSERT